MRVLSRSHTIRPSENNCLEIVIMIDVVDGI